METGKLLLLFALLLHPFHADAQDRLRGRMQQMREASLITGPRHTSDVSQGTSGDLLGASEGRITALHEALIHKFPRRSAGAL